jgi:cytochrome c oxidase assembly protein subunit 15
MDPHRNHGSESGPSLVFHLVQEFVLPASRSFAIAARLAIATTTLMFALIVVGSIVRTTGSGLACPDWPLCEGRVIPRFQFNVLIEWFHRVLALGVSLLLLSTTAWIVAHRDTRARLGGLVALAVGLLFTQILLGALTVWHLLHPAVVSSHLAVALLLFVTFLTTARVARLHAGVTPPSPASRPPGLLAAFGVVTALAYAQAVLGGVVSTNYAGHACPDWPTCNGEWFPALTGAVGLHMLHRYGAYLLTAAVLLAAFATRPAGNAAVRRTAWLAVLLLAIQVALGVTNVWLGIPVWVSAAHLGVATALIGTLVTATHQISLMTAAGTVAASKRARSTA